jgi:hypothetical protein
MEMTADELLAKVKARLHDDWLMSMCDDEHRLEDWHTAHPPSPEIAARNLKGFHYSHAKTMARDGNIEPLIKILTELTCDPDIASFITAPPASTRPKYARKDAPNPFYDKHEERQQQVETLWRIRQIVQQEMGTRNSRASVIPIAAKVMKCSQQVIKDLIKRGRYAFSTR